MAENSTRISLATDGRPGVERITSELDDANVRGQLRQAQELAGLTYIQFDLRDGRMCFGENYESILGFPPPSCFDDFLAHIHPEDQAHVAETDAKFRSTVGRYSVSYRTVVPSGQLRWIETRVETLADAMGRPERILMTSLDISRHKRTDLERIAASDQLDRVQAVAQVGTWEWDAAANVTNWSSAAWSLYEPGGSGDVTLQRWLSVLHPDDREAARRCAFEGLNNGHYTNEFRVVHPDGSVHWLRSTGHSTRDARGRPGVMRGVVLDVTDRKQAEEALARLAMIIDSTPDFVGWAGIDGRAVYINRAGRRMCGLGKTESIADKTIADFVAPHERERLLGEIREITQRDGFWSGELDMTDVHGRIFPVSKVSMLHRDANGNPYYVSTISRDISHEKNSETTLRETDRRKDEFLATLAHELRNPLVPLLNTVGILDQISASDGRLALVRKTIDQQTGYLTRLVDDLLDISRIATGKLELRREKLAISDVVAAAIDSCRPQIDAHRHTLDLQLPHSALYVDGDMVRLTQVMVNLLGNAVRYTNDAGRIALRIESDRNQVCITVEDNGSGIAAEFLPYVFDAFAQAETSRVRSSGGLGLGLKLVRQIVELHGGTVVVVSPGLGLGSAFTVRLPRMMTQRSSDLAATSADPVESSGIRVMVVDDYEAIRDSMNQLLTLRGYVVDTAADGASALIKAPVFNPDIIIIDLQMPGMNGYETARRLRRLPRLGNARLIAMTGDGASVDNRATDAGFDEFVVKPVPIGQLEAVLARKAAPPAAPTPHATGTLPSDHSTAKAGGPRTTPV